MALDILFQPRQSWASRTLSEYPFRIRVFGNKSDGRDVFGLRYRAYRNGGHIAPDSAAIFRDCNDDLETTAQIAAYDGKVCVGALRVSFSPPDSGGQGLPCAPYYPEVTNFLREPGRRLVEISRLAIDPEITNTSYKTTLYASLVRAGFMAAEAGNATDILIATKPEWVRFYEFMIGCTQIGKSTKYPPGDLEITLLGVTLSHAQTRQRLQNRFFQISLHEIESMRDALGATQPLSAMIVTQRQSAEPHRQASDTDGYNHF